MSLLANIIVAALAIDYAATSSVSFSYEYLENEDLIEVEISTPVNGTGESKYVAVAFALEPKMMSADGYYCTNQKLTSFSITNEYNPPFEFQSLGLVTLVSINVTDGELRCKFRRPVSVLKIIAGSRPYLFDLSIRSFSVLVAHGEVEGGRMAYHGNGNAKVLSQKIFVVRPTAVTASTCGKDKNCIHQPEGCLPSDPKCVFFSLRQVNNKVVVELSGGFGIGRQYVAAAFSQHHEMRDADMYYCDGRRLTSGVIKEPTKPPENLVDEFVNVTMAATINGIGQCRFSRDICVTKAVSKGKSESFDFATNLYYILYAHGNTTIDGNLTNHGIDGRGITKQALKLASGTDLQYECVTISNNKGISRRLDKSIALIALLGLMGSIIFW